VKEHATAAIPLHTPLYRGARSLRIALVGMHGGGKSTLFRAVQSTAVQQPILVPKGSLVTIVLQIPKMTLTAQGKALDNGSDGDTIRITNSQSKKVIEAEVTGPGKVVVRSADAVAIN